MIRKINEIIVHCSYTPPSMNIGADTIRRWHVDGRGWSDIGYHYVITRTGNIQKGRHENVQGAHVRDHNDYSLGICMVGGMSEEENYDSNFTLVQYRKLYDLIQDLKLVHDIEKVSGHRDYDNRKCPCFDVHELIRYP